MIPTSLQKLLPPAICEGYVFTGVCLSMGRGRAWLLRGEGRAWLLWGSVRGCSRGACVVVLRGCMRGCSRGGGRAWDMTRYGDTVNEQAVRILLECILVLRIG